MLFKHGFRQASIQTLLQQGKFLLEVAHQVVIGVFGLLPRQRKAPDLIALGFVVIRKPGAEAFKQIALVTITYTGKRIPSCSCSSETLAQVDRLLAGGLSGLRKQVGDADGDNHAVDGLATAVFTQQVDKFQPFPGVLNLLALLSGVAPRGIQQNRLVGKPPVTVARAANAAQRGFTEAVRQRELQPGVGQRGGFT